MSVVGFFVFLFFKQKTAYEMRISDWSSDVCSSDLKVDGGYRVSGQKRFITNAPVAGFVVLLCRDGTMMTELVIDLDQAGVKVGKPDRKIGNNGQLDRKSVV